MNAENKIRTLTISESGYYALTEDIVADTMIDQAVGGEVVVVLNLNGYTLTNYSTHTLTNNATLTISFHKTYLNETI